ncbi:hypothetical protein GCM10023094_19480 [Rhodococcus olei]|uniref:Uncharacterized protein n=1 Tax=Rhodococcus olei TaxID=2161675 RepID=A0ABP8NXS4_9NOCA
MVDWSPLASNAAVPLGADSATAVSVSDGALTIEMGEPPARDSWKRVRGRRAAYWKNSRVVRIVPDAVASDAVC